MDSPLEDLFSETLMNHKSTRKYLREQHFLLGSVFQGTLYQEKMAYRTLSPRKHASDVLFPRKDT